MSESLHPPKQKRSRETLARLLEATIEAVGTHGIEGATIPRIAQAAKVAPASVYRRFRDKESLLRAAFIEALAHSNTATVAAIPPLLEGRTLEWIAAAVARSLIAQYRARPTLMRAFVRFVEKDDDEEFRRRAVSLVAGNAETLVDAIVRQFGKHIADKDPRRAVTFAILVLASVAEMRVLGPFSLWSEMLPLSDDEMGAELQRLFLAYVQKPR